MTPAEVRTVLVNVVGVLLRNTAVATDDPDSIWTLVIVTRQLARLPDDDARYRQLAEWIPTPELLVEMVARSDTPFGKETWVTPSCVGSGGDSVDPLLHVHRLDLANPHPAEFA